MALPAKPGVGAKLTVPEAAVKVPPGTETDCWTPLAEGSRSRVDGRRYVRYATSLASTGSDTPVSNGVTAVSWSATGGRLRRPPTSSSPPLPMVVHTGLGQ